MRLCDLRATGLVKGHTNCGTGHKKGAAFRQKKEAPPREARRGPQAGPSTRMAGSGREKLVTGRFNEPGREPTGRQRLRQVISPQMTLARNCQASNDVELAKLALFSNTANRKSASTGMSPELAHGCLCRPNAYYGGVLPLNTNPCGVTVPLALTAWRITLWVPGAVGR